MITIPVNTRLTAAKDWICYFLQFSLIALKLKSYKYYDTLRLLQYVNVPNLFILCTAAMHVRYRSFRMSFFLFFLLQLFNNIFNDIYLYGIFFLILTYKICWQRKNWDTKNNAHKVDNGSKNGICSRINHCLR